MSELTVLPPVLPESDQCLTIYTFTVFYYENLPPQHGALRLRMDEKGFQVLRVNADVSSKQSWAA
jgi:hypothetical protein